MHFQYCPSCGETVDTGYTDEPGVAPCDNCDTRVEPITDADEASMPFKAMHSIECTDCGEWVRLAGLHMGKNTDGVIVACECSSLEAVPHALGEPELPSQWVIRHEAELWGDESEDSRDRPEPEVETYG